MQAPQLHVRLWLHINTTTLQQLTTATLNGSLHFPEIVGRLIQEGVEHYQVDYPALQFRFYGVQSYNVFLRGQRLLYVGRQGGHNVEYFPGEGQ